MRLVALFIMASVVTGCAFNQTKLKPLKDNVTIRGMKADYTMIVVNSPIIWSYASPPSYEEMCQLPTGTYIAEGTDGSSIYYKAPTPVSYSLQLSHYARDRKKRKGAGGIYLKLDGSPKVGAYFKTDKGVERVLEGKKEFFKQEGTFWKLKEDKARIDREKNMWKLKIE